MSTEHNYVAICQDFKEYEEWGGKVDGTHVQFKREIVWRHAAYEFCLQEAIPTDPQAFRKMFSEANSLREKDIQVELSDNEDTPSPTLKITCKKDRLDAPLEFSLIEDHWADPYFTDGHAEIPDLPTDLPKAVRDKVLKACKLQTWSALEEIGLSVSVERTMTGFLIYEGDI